MGQRYGGALWKPAGTFLGWMSEIRGISLHEAVTTGNTLWSWVNDEDAAHFFVAKDGTCEQYKEIGEIAFGVKDGNGSMLTCESWDGLQHHNELTVDGLGANETVWTWQQRERISDLIAFVHLAYGIPIRLMDSSKSTERGVAPHRWGVDPWRVSGGEVWTKHPGKACPGDLRIAQIPGILDRARALAAVSDYRPVPTGAVTTIRQLGLGTARRGSRGRFELSRHGLRGVPSHPGSGRGALMLRSSIPPSDWFDMATRADLIAALLSPQVLDAILAKVVEGTGQVSITQGYAGAADFNQLAPKLEPLARRWVNEETTKVVRSEGISGAADAGLLATALAEELTSVSPGLTQEQITAAVKAALARSTRNS